MLNRNVHNTLSTEIQKVKFCNIYSKIQITLENQQKPICLKSIKNKSL